MGDERGVIDVTLAPHPFALDPADLDCLAEDELKRAERLLSPAQRADFMARRVMLRRALGRRLGIEAADVRFDKGPFGKPFVRGRPDIEFSFSHARQLTLLAIGRTTLGADIESRENIINPAAVAARILSPSERLTWEQTPSQDRPQNILATWVRKEATVKAIGAGLRIDLASIEVESSAVLQPAPVRIDPSTGTTWFSWDLPAPHGYAAALVTDRADVEIAFVGSKAKRADQRAPADAVR